MEDLQILGTLKRARRALDALPQVDLLDDWEYDKKQNIWFLHIGITIEYNVPYIPTTSQWYVVVENNYPKGKIKVYPDIKNSINVTLYHQSNNARIAENGLWRKGALCLEINTLSTFQSEPNSIDERLLYHVARAINWLELAANNELVSKDEPFELPDFNTSNVSDKQFVFSEDDFTFMQWEDVEYKHGIAELDIYKNNPTIYYVKNFKSLNGQIIHYTQWGKKLSTDNMKSPIIAPWILLKDIPVINGWQAPETLGDLIDACNEQNINIMDLLKDVVPAIRDGKNHFLLIGFPVPKTFDGEPDIVFWKALRLPIVSYGKKTANGFRPNELGWWQRDKTEILVRKMSLDWVISENWNQREISQRGKMNNDFLRNKILIIGAGCMGASISEMLVRSGVYNLTIMDSDIFEVGNLSRHILSMDSIGNSKEYSLCKHLNSINPNTNVCVISNKLKINENYECNIDLEKYDVIIDCTGENSVLDVFENIKFRKNHVIASVSVGLGAKHLYITLMNGRTFDFNSFYTFIDPYLQSERIEFDDFDFPRDGIGCWHPTFPARSDDVWLAAATAVKAIERYIINKSSNNLSIIYEQKESDNYFEGYVIVDKDENGQDVISR